MIGCSGGLAAPAEVGLACAAVMVSSASRDATACVLRSTILCEPVEQVSRLGQLLGVGLALAAGRLLRLEWPRTGCDAVFEQQGSLSLRDRGVFCCENARVCMFEKASRCSSDNL